VVVAAALAGGCQNGGPQVVAVDLLRRVSAAERRPAASSFEVVDHLAAGQTLPGIRAEVPSRLTLSLVMPRRAVFRSSVVLTGPAPVAVRFRIGVSDDRIYETLAEVTVQPQATESSWTDIAVDLSAYAGRQWSLFYRPDGRVWRLVLAMDAAAGKPGAAVWGRPRIEASQADARAYVTRDPR
jgi:hypothetical protein